MKFTLLTLLLISSGSLYAQSIEREVIGSAGDFSVNGIQIEWTVGEIMTETYTGSVIMLTQGFHQTNLKLDGIEESEGVSFSVYPNPAKDQIKVVMDDVDDYVIALYDNAGRLVMQENKSNVQQGVIDLTTLSTGIYYVKVTTSDRALGSFKIFKTQ